MILDVEHLVKAVNFWLENWEEKEILNLNRHIRGLKYAPENLWQHGIIHVFVPHAVQEKIVQTQTGKRRQRHLQK